MVVSHLRPISISRTRIADRASLDPQLAKSDGLGASEITRGIRVQRSLNKADGTQCIAHPNTYFLIARPHISPIVGEFIQTVRASGIATESCVVLVWSVKDILYLRVEDQPRDIILFPQQTQRSLVIQFRHMKPLGSPSIRLPASINPKLSKPRAQRWVSRMLSVRCGFYAVSLMRLQVW